MLSFPPSFFEPEVRSGYFISEKMKRFWAASLEVLHQVQIVAEKHGLTIYADFGTLLGAIRHGGFIPWDDDIDVSMLRNEYQQLMNFLPSELPNGYTVYCHLGKNVPGAPKSFVSNSLRIETSSEFLKKNHGCPFITGIDIFPIDTVPDDGEMWETQKALYNAVYDAAFSYDKYASEGTLEGYLRQIEELLNVTISRSGDVKSELWRLSDRVASLFGPDEGRRLCYMADIVTVGEKKIRQKSWYASKTKIDFENMHIAVPVGYDHILRSIYGDYARIFRGGSKHDYPVYKRLDSDNRYLEKHFEAGSAILDNEPFRDHKKGKVLFLIREADKWSFFEELYEKENNGINDVKVIALPYRHKDENLKPGENVFSEEDKLRKDLPIVSPDDYDIKTELPERVYIQDPFDSYSLSTETDPAFFTENIRTYAGEIIMVVPFNAKVRGLSDEMQKEMFRTYVDTPGCLLSDKIYVCNKGLADLLSGFESISNRICVMDKTSAGGFPKRTDGVKNILFTDDISHFAGCEEIFTDKYSSIIQLFEENTDKLHVYWCLAKGTPEALDVLSDDTRDIYIATLNELVATNWCTVIENPSEDDIRELLDIADAAYGAPGPITTRCIDKHIPVMIWDINII